MDYSTYTACLSAYHRLEQSDDKKLYTRRYRQFLLQVFSADSVLQLVPNAAIQLLQKYSEGGPPDPRLQPLIPALGMIFLNAYYSINNQYSFVWYTCLTNKCRFSSSGPRSRDCN